jgi:hypothetical protein
MVSLRIENGRPIILQADSDVRFHISTHENGDLIVKIEKVKTVPLRIEIPENKFDIEGYCPGNEKYKKIKEKMMQFHHFRSMSLELDRESYFRIKKMVHKLIKSQFEVETTVSHSPYGYSAESRPILTGFHVFLLGDSFEGTTLKKNTLEKLLTSFGAIVIKYIQPHTDFVIVGRCNCDSIEEKQYIATYTIPEIRAVGTLLSCIYEFALNYSAETHQRIQRQHPLPPVPAPFLFPFPTPSPVGIQFHMGINYKHLAALSRSKQEKEMERYNLSEESKQIVQKNLALRTSEEKTPRTTSISEEGDGSKS